MQHDQGITIMITASHSYFSRCHKNLGSSPNSGSADSDIAGSGEFAVQQIQLQQQAASSNAACGQVVSGVVNLTANLNCSSGDGIIVGGPNTVINMNGFSITGPGQDRL